MDHPNHFPPRLVTRLTVFSDFLSIGFPISNARRKTSRFETFRGPGRHCRPSSYKSCHVDTRRRITKLAVSSSNYNSVSPGPLKTHNRQTVSMNDTKQTPHMGFSCVSCRSKMFTEFGIAALKLNLRPSPRFA